MCMMFCLPEISYGAGGQSKGRKRGGGVETPGREGVVVVDPTPQPELGADAKIQVRRGGPHRVFIQGSQAGSGRGKFKCSARESVVTPVSLVWVAWGVDGAGAFDTAAGAHLLSWCFS